MGMGHTVGFAVWVAQVWVWCQIHQPTATLHLSWVTCGSQPQCGNLVFPSCGLSCAVPHTHLQYALVLSLKQIAFTLALSHLRVALPLSLTLALTLALALAIHLAPSHTISHMAPPSPGPLPPPGPCHPPHTILLTHGPALMWPSHWPSPCTTSLSCTVPHAAHHCPCTYALPPHTIFPSPSPSTLSSPSPLLPPHTDMPPPEHAWSCSHVCLHCTPHTVSHACCHPRATSHVHGAIVFYCIM